MVAQRNTDSAFGNDFSFGCDGPCVLLVLTADVARLLSLVGAEVTRSASLSVEAFPSSDWFSTPLRRLRSFHSKRGARARMVARRTAKLMSGARCRIDGTVFLQRADYARLSNRIQDSHAVYHSFHESGMHGRSEELAFDVPASTRVVLRG